MSADVPRRLPPTQGERVRNIDRGHASLSARGRTASSRPVPQQGVGAALYQPETWAQSYSYPGDLTVTPGTARIYNETTRIMALRQIRAAVGTVPSGASVIIDVKVNGASIFATPSDRPAITAGGNVAAITAPPRTLFRPGDYLTVDIAQIGSTTPGSDLTVQIRAV